MKRCETCVYRSQNPFVNPDRGTAEFEGVMYACKRRAPVATGGLYCPTMTIWPMVTAANWCGEHEITPEPPSPCEHGLAELECDKYLPF